MRVCPEKNNPKYQELEKEFGEIQALSIFHMNNGEIPTIKQGKKLLDSKILNVLHHMDTAEDLKGKLSGPLGENLSKEGREEAHRLAKTEEIKNLKTIYCSDAPRAIETTKIYKENNPDLQIIINPNLRTWDRGRYVGGLETDFPAKYYLKRPDEKVPGGESYNTFFNKFVPAINEISKNITENVGVLVHGDGIKTLLTLEDNWGKFNPETYLKDNIRDGAEKPFQTIRHFSTNTELNNQTPTQEVNNNKSDITQNQQINPLFEPNQGLTQSTINPTSENSEYKNTNNLSPDSFEDALGRMVADQKRIYLNDFIIDPITGQKREHTYTEILLNGTTFIADGSVTGVKVEKALKNFQSGLPQDELNKELALFASESGTLEHSFAENAWKNILDKNGRLLSEDDFKEDNEPALTDNVNRRIYTKIKDFVINFAKTFPENTRFFTEIRSIDKDFKWKERIYDEQTKTYSYKDKIGLGMSADLLAFTPDNVCHMFDYKSTSKLEQKKEIPTWKIVAINAQLPEYKRILEKNYGFKEFGMMRAIPINNYYQNYNSKKTINGQTQREKPKLINAEIGNASGVNKPEKSYLDFIPCDEEAVRDTRINELDKKLQALESNISQIRTQDINKQEELQKQIKDLRKARHNLKLLQDTNSFKAQVEKTIQFAQEYFDNAKNNLLNLSPIDRHNLKNKLIIFSDLSTTFEEGVSDLQKIIKDPTESEKNKKEAKDLYDQILEFSKDATTLLKTFDELAITTANNLEIKNIGLNPNLKEREFSWEQQTLTTQSRLGHQMSDLLWMIKKQNISEVKDEMKLLIPKIEKLKEQFQKITGAKEGKAFYDAIDKYFHSKTTVYTKEFWDKVNKGRDKQNKLGVKELKNLLDFDKESYDLAFEKLKEKLENSNIDKKDKAKRLENFKKKYNINFQGINRYAWQNKKNYFLKPKPEFKSKEYLAIQENPEIKEIFEGTFKLIHNKAQELGLIKPGTSIFKIFEGTEAKDTEAKARGIKTNNSWKERNIIKEKDILKTLPVDPMTNEVIRKISHPTFQHAEIPTRDIFQATIDLYEKLLTYEKKVEDEGLILDLITKEQSRLLLNTNRYGKSANELGVEMPGNKNVVNLKLFKENVYQYLYGEEPHNKDFVLNVPFVGKVSMKKLATTPVHFFVLSKLGLNPKSLTSNFVGGFGHVYMIYGKLALKAFQMIVTRDPKLMALMHYFNFTVGVDGERKKLDLTGVPFNAKVNIKNIKDVTETMLMSGMEFTEHLVQKVVLACHILNKMVDKNGNIVSIKHFLTNKPEYKPLFNENTTKEDFEKLNKQFEKEQKTLEENNSLHAITSVDEHGHVTFTNPITQEQEDFSKTTEEKINSEKVHFENGVQDDIKSVLGTKDADDRTGTEGSLLMTLLSTFRKWIANVIQHKFGKVRYNASQDTLFEGYWKHFAAQWTKELFLPMVKSVLNNMTGGGFSSDLAKGAKINYERLKDKARNDGNNFDAKGNPYGISYENYVLHHKLMLGKQFRDIGAILITASLICAINAIASNDDDPQDKYRDIYVSRYFQKYFNEFTFFVDPTEFQNLLGNSVPVLGLFTELIQTIYNSYEYMLATLGSDEAIDQAHPGKYFLRMMPLGSTTLDLLGFDEDFREDWGMKPGQIRY